MTSAAFAAFPLLEADATPSNEVTRAAIVALTGLLRDLPEPVAMCLAGLVLDGLRAQELAEPRTIDVCLFDARRAA